MVTTAGPTSVWDNRESLDPHWRPGTVIVPPEDWLHQHFNSGVRPARYLALRMHGKRFIQPANRGGEDAIAISSKLGGWQVEYEDEDPQIHAIFESELARHGATCRM